MRPIFSGSGRESLGYSGFNFHALATAEEGVSDEVSGRSEQGGAARRRRRFDLPCFVHEIGKVGGFVSGIFRCRHRCGL